MNLLLDTHVVIWVFSRDPRLSRAATDAIRDGNNVVFVSAATAWEIAIKKSLGKLRAPDNYREALERYRFTPLSVTTEHALAVEHLPPHHKDPFDRLLIAQARIETLTLVTGDPNIHRYGVPIIHS